MNMLERLSQKKYCWDIIKKYFPKYESKNSLYKEIVEQYLFPSAVLLDTGCGSGKETPLDYSQRVRLAIGVDISKSVLENNNFHQKIIANVEQIPLENNYANIILCQELIEHLLNPDKFFREVSRILRKSGIFIMMTPNLWGWRSLISRLTPYSFHRRMNKQLYDIEDADVFPTYYRANTLFTVQRLLKKYGMKMVKCEFFEPSPRTLTFSAVTTYGEIMYTKLIRKYRCLRQLRETLIIVAVKNNE